MGEITLNQFWAGILTACAAIVALGGAGTWIVKLVGALRKPETKQDERITGLEERMGKVESALKEHEGFFKNDNDALNSLQEGVRILLQGTLALMAHAINGNDIDSLKRELEKLQRYLTER